MANLTVQNIATTGLNPTYAAAAGGGDTFTNDGQTYYHVKNGGGGSINATFTSVATSLQKDGIGTITLTDLVVAVPAAGERIIGPFATGRFNNTSGLVSVAYSGVTTVTVAAVRLPSP